MRLDRKKWHAKCSSALRCSQDGASRIHSAPIFKKLSLYLSRKSPRSLANRILLLQLGWALIVYVFFILALWFAINLVIENSVKQQGEGWIAKLDELGIPIYASNDPSQMAEALSYVHNFPEVVSAQYLDITGQKITAEYTRKDTAKSGFLPLNGRIIEKLARTDVTRKTIVFEKGDNSRMRISAPIWIKSISKDGMIDFSLKNKNGEQVKTIGFIDIVLDYSHISAALSRNLAYASLVVSLLMFAAAYLGRIIVRWALNPLSDLEEPLTRLANGETDVIVKNTGDKEIDRIGKALNTTISALNERDESLRRMANHDSLTGLVNRKYFVEKLEKEIGRIAVNNGSSALFFFDLDRFKYINDTYGHAAGDRLLIQIAAQLSKRMRDNDLVARFGGDEFTLLAYNVNANSAQDIAESFIELMRDFTFYEAGDSLKIHFSIGITIIDDSALTSHEYLKEADTAVHDAKAHGRNGYRMFKRDMQSSSQETGIGWHERLQTVLNNAQAIPYFQPLHGLKQQKELINEVLLRLPDAEQGVLRPGAFMPAAERFGLMAEFDRQMIEKVAQILAMQKDADLIFSFNLSEQIVEEDKLLHFLEKITKKYQISPRHFIFELAEQHMMRNLDKLKVVIPALSEQGFRFAIDDFGAGFSSFNYIKQFPVHFLKIDCSLIDHITTDRIDRITVRSIVDIAADLNMQTIAKFVPDQESMNMLQEMGVDFAQGHFTGAPSSQISGRADGATY